MVRELVILEMVDSENVIKVYEFIKTKRNYYMIQEFANGGNLQRLLDLHERFPEAIARVILR
jgi:serine/threonine protein kinase